MIGGILLRQGHRDQAIPHLERSLEMEPDNSQALYNLAGAYSMSMEYGKAREVLERLMQVSPRHQEGRKLLESLPEESE
jgi:Tfp pilus assembly protein PilF